MSNGMAWSPDWAKMYYIDTYVKKIYCFDYDESSGTITNQAVVIDYAQDANLGLPDGMTVDTDGKLWVAGCTQGVVTQWDPITGKKIGYIPFPVQSVSSCCFGGAGYSKLFVTSPAMYADKSSLLQYPHSGAVFVVEGLGVHGLPSQKFKGNATFD